jgi:imidazolonepropionase
MPRFDLAVVNARSIVTCASPDGLKRGREMRETGTISRGVVGIKRGRIAWVGSPSDYRRRHRAAEEIDAEGGLIIPGFVDCHTHALFAGTRIADWRERLSGVDYLEILGRGGGILETVRQTRKASPAKLVETATGYLLKMLSHGTTTVEVKSGYGLAPDEEIKLLRVIERLRERLPLDVVPTFLGAHAVPPESAGDPERYVEAVIEMLPEVRRLARFCDAYCEKGAFDADQSERILKQAKAFGMGVKLHAGQFNDLGGVEVALNLQAASVDHLETISGGSIRRLAASDTVGVLLPAAAHFLSTGRFPPARELIDAGAPVALATDFNPGSSPCLSLQEVIGLAVLKMGMTPEEALVGATLNAAAALGLARSVGSVEAGKQADLVCLALKEVRELPYFFGANHVRWVVKKGIKL